MTNPSRIRILCVDDHPLVCEGVARKLELQPDMKVVALASTGEEALDLFEKHHPDVTLMDLSLPGMSGLDTIMAIRRKHPAARIVVLTMYSGEEDIYRALEAGAAAYVLKTIVSQDLVRVVREVHAGEKPALRDVSTRVVERTDPRRHPTAREQSVIELMVRGMRNKEIAATLGISEATVEVHVKNLFSKLHVRHRTEAVTEAIRRGIVHLEQ